MRLPVTFAFGLVLSGWAAAEQNVVNGTAMAELSPCVMQCTSQVLSEHDCILRDACFCSDKLTADLTHCTAACPFSEQLEAIYFQATTCKRPIRDLGAMDALFFGLYAIATLFTIARITSRFHKFGGAGFGWDDLAAIISYIPLTALTICDVYTIHAGGGTDIWGLTSQNIYDFIFWFYLDTIFYTPVLFLTKISLVLLYLRIWPSEVSFRSACFVALSFLLAAYAAFQLVAIVQCTPVDFQWARLKDPKRVGTCIDREAWVWSLAIIAILIDLAVLVLPIPNIVKLRVPISRKAGLCAVFSVGVIVTIISCVRLQYVRGFATRPNPTRLWGFVGIYSNVEAYLSQICCCLPTIPGLVRRSYRYATGKPLTSVNATADRQGSLSPRPPISGPIAIPKHDYSRSTDKTRTFSSSSNYSATSAAPAPVVRQSNPFPLYVTPYSEKDYRQTGYFGGTAIRDEDENDGAQPPPAIQRT